MPAFTWTPDHDLKVDTTARVRKIAFGDGYSAREAKGINSLDETLPLSFTLRTNTEIEEIIAFREARNGVEAFTYTPPGKSGVRKYTCSKWSKSYNHDLDVSLSCTFEREYDI